MFLASGISVMQTSDRVSSPQCWTEIMNLDDRQLPHLPVQFSLRLRVALGIALPILLLLLGLSWVHYQRERSLLEQQIILSATQIGDTTLGSLRHVMLDKDELHIKQILTDVGQTENIQQLFLVGLDGHIAWSSQSTPQKSFTTLDLGCQECHQNLPEERQRATLLQTQLSTLRISTPIENDPACQSCHDSPNHLGMLLVDISMVDTRAQLLRDLTTDLAVSIVFTLLITLGVYLLMNRLIVHRVERLQQPISALASGDFKIRLPTTERPRDELDRLTHDVNHMADDLERYVEERERYHQSRYQTMLEERERIAREMHDGVAQLMGYVNTKSSAIRLNLEKERTKTALEQLEQLALASQEAIRELRTSILGLRAAGMGDQNIRLTLATFLSKFNELTGIEIQSDLPESDEEIVLSPEHKLHVLRITQEALSNIHKHSGAKSAQVSLKAKNGQVELRIRDNGDGFDTLRKPLLQGFSQGVLNMRERAAAMGATLDLSSGPEQGTEIVLRIPTEIRT